MAEENKDKAVKQKDNDIKGKKTTEKEEKEMDAMVCLVGCLY